MVTAVDFFCGAGGSSTGMVAAGIEVRGAANHWALAIETHNTNHPATEHYLDDLMQAHPSNFPYADICWMSPECFPANTLILTQRGLVPIEDICKGDHVLTHRGRWQPVMGVMQTVRDTIVVKGQGHYGLETTAEHPFYGRQQIRIWDNDRRDYDRRVYCDPEWVEAHRLTESAYRWATPLTAEPVGIPFILNSGSPAASSVNRGLSLSNLNLWWLVGRWLGDGTVRHHRGRGEITIVCGKHEADELSNVLAVWKPQSKRIAWDELRWRKREIRTAVLFECGHSGLADWLVDNFGKLAHGKTIPAWALTMPVEFREALLAGYISADGSIGERSTHITTVSKRLAIGIRLLLASLGYHATLGRYKNHNQIEGRQVNVRPQYVVRWENNKSQRTGFCDDMHAWTLVKEVQKGRTSITVYNLSVAEDESYVADGIVVHNCTNHSLAKGRKRKAINQLDLWGNTQVDPDEERSRATMREVVEFAEYHKYPMVIVENVVDIRHWAHYDDWLQAMRNLGYDYRTLYLNAQFFGVPQSRDRWYTVFWRRGNNAPALDFRPAAWCEQHGEVQAVQAWKSEKQWGRYGKGRQYVYRCPQCGAEVYPATVPASAVIDWSIPAPLIGARARPLKPKTIERIKAGLRKFAGEAVQVELSHGSNDPAQMVDTVQQPMRTQTTAQTLGLAVPPFLMSYYTRDNAQSRIDEPLPVVTTEKRHAVVVPPFLLSYANQESPPRSVSEPSFAFATGFTPRLLIPPFITPLRGTAVSTGVEQPLSTIVACASQHALVMSYYGGNSVYAPVDRPLPTMRTVAHQALIQVDSDAVVDACGFRMLEPDELKRGMSFPDEYIILGSKRDQVRQVGNAVACNVAEWIVRRCVEALA